MDVAVLGPKDGYPGGEVHIFPLVVGGGTTPTPILDAVEAICSEETVRPLCDLVIVATPSAVTYNIAVDLTTYDWAIDGDVIANVGQLLNDYAQSLKSKLKLDVIKAKIESICMQPEVYNCVVNFPISDITLLGYEYAEVGSITVNITGSYG